MLRTLRPVVSAWPVLLVALACGLVECLALWRSRLGDRLGRPR